jgi:hypothetical protein
MSSPLIPGRSADLAGRIEVVQIVLRRALPVRFELKRIDQLQGQNQKWAIFATRVRDMNDADKVAVRDAYLLMPASSDYSMDMLKGYVIASVEWVDANGRVVDTTPTLTDADYNAAVAI